MLYGWSLGGVLAYAVAKLLRESGADVRIVGLIDTVMAGEKVEDTPDEIRKRWQRYAAFAKKTYNVDYPLPYDKLAAAESDEEQIKILTELLKLSGTKIPVESSSTSARRGSTTGRSRPPSWSSTTATSSCTWPTATTTT